MSRNALLSFALIASALLFSSGTASAQDVGIGIRIGGRNGVDVRIGNGGCNSPYYRGGYGYHQGGYRYHQGGYRYDRGHGYDYRGNRGYDYRDYRGNTPNCRPDYGYRPPVNVTVTLYRQAWDCHRRIWVQVPSCVTVAAYWDSRTGSYWYVCPSTGRRVCHRGY